jgi:predicted nucleotidyltransferase
MPGPRSLVDTFVSRLEKLEMPYVVTGAVASIIYGEPRLTNDVDLIMMMKTEDIERFVQAFPSTEFYCPPVEVLKIEIRRPHRGHFNLIHHDTGTKADIYLAGEDELHRWALSKKRDMAIEGERVRVAPPEYVIVRKLEYYREGGSEKHLRDIAGMVELSSDEIDFKQIEEFIHRYGLEKEWAKAKSMAGLM